METPASMIRNKNQISTFGDIPEGSTFELNGNVWTKRNTKTAVGMWTACLPEWFRIGKHEKIYIDS